MQIAPVDAQRHEDTIEARFLRAVAHAPPAPIALGYIEFNDWSLKKPFDSEDAEYVRRGIRERIRQCSVIIVYLSDKTAESKWVEWEVREAIAMGKGVVAMYKGDSPPARLPKVVVDHGVPVVPWNQRELAAAIARQSQGS